jgi:predicted unusual protein kinase regulating ubiquinone biosynthesis (AarF/ABC1/UbiB family)
MAISMRPQQVRRYGDIARLLTKYGRGTSASYVRDRWNDQPGDPLTVEAEEQMAADALALAADLERLGPTFVKLGQLLSTRTDLLPPPYIEALSRLQERCDPVPLEAVAAVVQEEFGLPIDRAFAAFDRVPLAAASLGQVHRARLHDGRDVAVKVQRPDVVSGITEDLEAIAEIAALADRHTETGKRLGFCAMVEEFRRSMLAELDYRREAANLRLLGRNLEGFDRIVVPQPIDDLCTRRVLTMEFIDGRPLPAAPDPALDGSGLAGELAGAYLHQIVEDGFFHADPHPGNVRITTDGRLALLDVGMTARLTRPTRDALLQLLMAMSDGDGEEAATAAITLGDRRDDADFDEAAFVRRVTELVADQQALPVDRLSPGAVLGEVSRIAADTGLRPQPELTMLGKALFNLDEVARRLDPDFVPTDAVRTYAAGLLRRRLVPTPGRMLAATMEAKEFAEQLPGRVNHVMDALARGELTLNVQGVDETQILGGIHRLANRLASAILLAALVIGAAMMMRIDTPTRLFGYPAVAIVCFLLAAGGGFGLLARILWTDRHR